MHEPTPPISESRIAIGPFTLASSPKQLLFEGQPLALCSSSLDILTTLLERPGVIVSTAELLARTRLDAPHEIEAFDTTDKILEHAANINKLIGERVANGYYVAHYPGEGFSFVAPAPVKAATLSRLSLLAPLADQRTSRAHTKIIGREAVIARLARQLPQQRFVTIVGAGGMGKTTVALALAAQVTPLYRDGVYVVDLAPLDDARLVPRAVASALGLALTTPDILGGLAAFVRHKHMLIVLDSCEHVLEATAVLAEAMLEATTSVHVLTTSREPLMARGEWLHRLSPLGLPLAKEAVTDKTLISPAVQLFIERAMAANAGYVFHDADAEQIAVLCRQLDGIPLAIEIAAARAGQFGVTGLTTQVEGRLLSLTGARRTAPPRHKTLAAMLDWSHDLLQPQEKCVLRRLAVFRGNFTLEAAAAVAADEANANEEVTQAVLGLVEKSLVASVQGNAPNNGLRLLDTTRAYAREKLGVDTEYAAVSLRHAQYLRALLGIAETEWETLQQHEWLSTYGPWIADIRRALEWSFAPGGDEALGIKLTFASFSLARQLSLDAEFKDYVQRALNELLHVSPRQYLVEITLKAYIGSMGQRVESQDSPLYKSLGQILDLGDANITPRDQVIALGSLNHASLMAANFSDAVVCAARANKAAHESADPVAIMITERMQAQAQHFMGQHASAQTLAQNVLDNSWRKIPLAYNPSPVSQRVSMRILQARIFWLRGLSVQAEQLAQECLLHAQSDTAISQCQALAMCALPIALWNGHDQQCVALVNQLAETSARHSLLYWQHWANSYREVLSLRGTDSPLSAEAPGRSAPISQALLQQGAFEANLRDHLCTFSQRLLGPDNIERVHSAVVGWCAPEVLRLQAEAAWVSAPNELSNAEAMLHRSIEMAGEQRALSWQLRSATTLANLLHSHGRTSEARDQLASVFDQFTEGFENADLVCAKQLLDKLQSSRTTNRSKLRLCP